jgi:hypothetical protein
MARVKILWQQNRNSFIRGSASPRNGPDLRFNPRCPMTRISSFATATAIATLLLTGSAFAQTAAPAAKDATKTETKSDTKMAPAEKKEAKPRTAESLECSKAADAKGLHGKERKKFRSECKKGGAEKAK